MPPIWLSVHLLRILVFAIAFLPFKVSGQAAGCNENYFLKTYTNADSSLGPLDMVVTGDDDVIVCGYFYSIPTDSDDGFIFRLDKSGAKLWEITLTGQEQQVCRKIIRLRDNNFLVAGYDIRYLSHFLLKIDINGNIIWRKNLLDNTPTVANPGIQHIREAEDGSIYMVSFYSDPVSHGMLFTRCDNAGTVIYSHYYKVGNSLNPLEIRDMVIKDHYAYVVGSHMNDTNTPYVYHGLLAKIDTNTGNLLWTKLYNYNNGPEIFQQVFDYAPGQLCILGQNTINSSDLNNVLICDTSGTIQHLSYFQFGAYRQFGNAALDDNGNILYSNFLTGNGPVDLAMCLVNPYTGVSWAKHFPVLTPFPRINKVLFAGNSDIYSVGQIFPGKACVFVGKHSSEGETGCVSEPFSISFGISNSIAISATLAQTTKSISTVSGVAPPFSELITGGLPACVAPSPCTSLALLGSDSFCSLTDTLTLTIIKNQGCVSIPEFIYDTSFLKLLSFENNIAKFIGKKSGVSSIVAEIRLSCDTLSGIKSLNVWPNPEPQLGLDTTLCLGNTRTLNPGEFSSYLWQDGHTGATYTVTDTGFYKVIVANNYQCKWSDSITINKTIPQPSGFLPKDTSMCRYGNIILKPLQTYIDYTWNTSEKTPEIVVSNPGIYWLEVRDNNQCSGKDSMIVNTKECSNSFYIPSAFTPDNNGRNDIYKPIITGNVKFYQFTIYNRWGEVVFKTSELNKGWDGRLNGKKQDTFVFAWNCTYELEGSARKSEKGTVVLIR